jgi:hypothetical protein
MDGCMVDPAGEDWGAMDEADLHYHAQDGIPQAIDERRRRERLRLDKATAAYRAAKRKS